MPCLKGRDRLSYMKLGFGTVFQAEKTACVQTLSESKSMSEELEEAQKDEV